MATAGLFFSATTNAATFTAVTSGNFSASSTWGGSAPSGSILGDIIIIPTGVNVTMDQNVELNGVLSSLTVNGTLTSSNNSYLVLTLGSLSGQGSIVVDSMSSSLTSGITFVGSITADNFTSMGSTFSSSANITVNKGLRLMSGLMNMTSGNLTLGTGAMIWVSGGTMSTSGGVANLTNNYSVVYLGSSATTGIELSGSGLSGVEVNVPSGSSVKLGSDLMLDGMLTLTSGELDLNGNDLELGMNSGIVGTGTGTITSTSGSNIRILSSGNLTGALRFTSGSNTVNDFVINMGSGSSAMLGSDLNVNGTLNLQSGMLNIGGNNLVLGSGGTWMGGSSSSYIITGVGGRFTQTLNAGASATYYVGTATRFMPAVMTANSGSANSMLSVGVNQSVLAQGTTGSDMANSNAVVNATWFVTSSVNTGLNLKMQTMWNANSEVNGFDRSKAYISHYVNGSWDVSAQTSATTASNGMYTISRDNITSLSPFAVMQAGATSIENIAAENTVALYPNPTTNVLNITMNGKADYLTIYDVAGRPVKSMNISGGISTLSVEDLPQGMYYAHFEGNNFKVVERFVKQ